LNFLGQPLRAKPMITN